MLWNKIIIILSLFGYQVWVWWRCVGCFGPVYSREIFLGLCVPICLLLLLYFTSLARASHYQVNDALWLPWRALFAANVAFLIVGTVSCSITWPGQCTPVGPIAALYILTYYWPIFVIRSILPRLQESRAYDVN